MSRIAEIDLRRLEVPLAVPYKLAFGDVRAFDVILVELLDDNGRRGLGEATILEGYTNESVDGAWTRARALAEEAIGAETEAARQRIAQHHSEAPFTVSALTTAIEMAEGAPDLAHAGRRRLPLLAVANATRPDELEREIECLLEQGYTTLKVKVGFDIEPDLARVARIHRIAAGRATLRLDGNQGYDRADAIRFATTVDPDGIELFEQPCPAGDWEAAEAVAAVAGVPMMLDESIYDESDIERAAELGAATYIKLKLMKAGGLARLDAQLGRIRELGMVPVVGNGVATEISCWMEACVAYRHLDNAGEMNGFLKPARRIVEAPLTVERGALVLEPGYRPRLANGVAETLMRAHARFGHA